MSKVEKEGKEPAEVDTKYKLPDILLTEFTPAEVSNMTHLFEELDEDKSGAIDVVELGVLFDKLEEEMTQEKLREIIAEVDDDDSGELEFPEFMMLMAKFKKGDSKFAKAASMLNDLNSTPAAELERQCNKRGLKVSYAFVETREATSMAAQQEIYNCTVVGEWIERIKGKMIKTIEPRTFQGIASTTRDSKMAAAQAALSKLKEAIPGVAFIPGVIPSQWRKWYEQNMDNGIDPGELLLFHLNLCFCLFWLYCYKMYLLSTILTYIYHLFNGTLFFFSLLFSSFRFFLLLSLSFFFL